MSRVLEPLTSARRTRFAYEGEAGVFAMTWRFVQLLPSTLSHTSTSVNLTCTRSARPSPFTSSSRRLLPFGSEYCGPASIWMSRPWPNVPPGQSSRLPVPQKPLPRPGQ